MSTSLYKTYKHILEEANIACSSDEHGCLLIACKVCSKQFYPSNTRRLVYNFKKFGKPIVFLCSDLCKQNCEEFSYFHKFSKPYTVLNLATYETFYSRLERFGVPVRRSKQNTELLETKCHNCGKWFVPKYSNTQGKIKELSGLKRGQGRFYCSPTCRKAGVGPNLKKYRRLNIPLYDTYADRLSSCGIECKRNEADSKILMVKCYLSSCNNFVVPTIGQVDNKTRQLEGKLPGNRNIYCSDECKKNCSTFKRYRHRKGEEPNSRREDQGQFRELVFKRDGYKCQICGSKNNIEAHHIIPVVKDPIESMDIDNGITLCIKCHHKVHKGDCATRTLTC